MRERTGVGSTAKTRTACRQYCRCQGQRSGSQADTHRHAISNRADIFRVYQRGSHRSSREIRTGTGRYPVAARSGTQAQCVNEKHKQQSKRRIENMTTFRRKRRRICMNFLISMKSPMERSVPSNASLALVRSMRNRTKPKSPFHGCCCCLPRALSRVPSQDAEPRSRPNPLLKRQQLQAHRTT
jgi:hypothetical protein